MAKVSEQVQRVFRLVVRHLGETFSLQDLTLFVASSRGKPLYFEQQRTPMAISGYCLALQDIDLIVTRIGMDEFLARATQLHEIAHLLLRHLPLHSEGTETPTYEEFQRAWNSRMLSRDNQYDDPQEQDAETLATLLMQCIERQEASLPEVAKDIYGW